MTTTDEQRPRIANAPDPDRIPWHDLPPPDEPTSYESEPDPGPDGSPSGQADHDGADDPVVGVEFITDAPEEVPAI